MSLSLELAQLGDSDSIFQLHDAHDHLLHAAAMIRQAKRNLAILSLYLDPQIFNQPSLIDALKELAMKSPRSNIRIMLQDNSLVLQQGHQLVSLAQRLPSVIAIRKPSQEFAGLAENFILIDETAYLHQPEAENYHGHACYYDSAQASRLKFIFTEAWEHGAPDRELSPLHI